MIVAPHQANFLPGVSVMSKIAAADRFLICDEMQYTRFGFVNRNRFSEGDGYGPWMTVPVTHDDFFAPIKQVRIDDPHFRVRRKIAKTMQHRMGNAAARPFVDELMRPWKLLVGLNLALLRVLCDGLQITTPWVFQSHLATGVRESTVSDRLACMTEEIGGTVYLSGPSGRKYLDETPFVERGIEVRYWSHTGPNPTAAEQLCRRVEAVA